MGARPRRDETWDEPSRASDEVNKDGPFLTEVYVDLSDGVAVICVARLHSFHLGRVGSLLSSTELISLLLHLFSSFSGVPLSWLTQYECSMIASAPERVSCCGQWGL